MKRLFLGRQARVLYLVAVMTPFVGVIGASKKFNA